MLKLLTIIALSTSLVTNTWAKTVDQRVESFEKRRINSNPNLKLESLKLAFKKELKDGWYGYLFDIKLLVNGKPVDTKDIIFSNGKMITSELKNLKNSLSFKRFMHPTLDFTYYNKSNLIAGNIDAKHKLVVFSDPLCPNCTTLLPELIKDAQANPTILSLYYISLPLDMHPTAKTIIKASKIAKQQGVKNVDYKVYTANFEKHFDPYQNKDNQKTLDAFNKVLKTNITMKQILNNKYLDKKIKSDKTLSDKAFINGTPTLFTDGEVDLTRAGYKKFIK
jgi:predicted DsbA family dithiol-disulfide isomerase